MPRQHAEHIFETVIEHHLTTAGGYEKDDMAKRKRKGPAWDATKLRNWKRALGR